VELAPPAAKTAASAHPDWASAAGSESDEGGGGSSSGEEQEADAPLAAPPALPSAPQPAPDGSALTAQSFSAEEALRWAQAQKRVRQVAEHSPPALSMQILHGPGGGDDLALRQRIEQQEARIARMQSLLEQQAAEHKRQQVQLQRELLEQKQLFKQALTTFQNHA